MTGRITYVKRLRTSKKIEFKINNGWDIKQSIVDTDSDALIRKTYTGFDIIWGKRRFICFPSVTEKKSNVGKSHIFGNVAKCVNNYISQNEVKKRKSYPQTYESKRNKKYRGKKIAQTDINHAYWRIAFLQCIITENIYLSGLSVREKSVKLAALSNISSDKVYHVVKSGKLTKDLKIVKADERKVTLYNNIRNICFGHMMRLSKLLGYDFLEYRVDCIYYVDKIKNRKIVEDYLTKKGFSFKTKNKTIKNAKRSKKAKH
jgi:hypothetical protein